MNSVQWYTYFKSCYDHIQDNTYVIFDYCECHVPKEEEEPFFYSKTYDKAVFCHNNTVTPQLTRTPQPTNQLIVQSTRSKKPKITLAIFYQIILFE